MCLHVAPLKTTVFQGFYSRALQHRQSKWNDVTWSYSSAQKSKRPHPGTQILSQILKGGKGNRGQMPHIHVHVHVCPGSPRSGLTLIDA